MYFSFDSVKETQLGQSWHFDYFSSPQKNKFVLAIDA